MKTQKRMMLDGYDLSIKKTDGVLDLIKKSKKIRDILEYTENPLIGDDFNKAVETAKNMLDICLIRLAQKTSDELSDKEKEELDLLKLRVWSVIEWEFESQNGKTLFLN